MAKNLNKATLIGNVTQDPELRYTPQGTAVCSFSIATNRQWKTDSGETKDSVEFHRIVAWAQLAEICAKILRKGSKAYVEGRLQTRQWEAQDGAKRSTTEIVISDMIALDSRRSEGEGDFAPPDDFDPEIDSQASQEAPKPKAQTKLEPKPKKATGKTKKVVVEEEDIPF